MAVKDYLLTFRIADETVGNRSPNKRRTDLYAEVEKLSVVSWDEPTSFALFDSEKDIDTIANAFKRKISTDHDVVLIVSVYDQAARVIGKVEEFDMLRAFMTYVRKV